jgi:ribosomal protein S18 acetylase RimI-like enzyme
MGLLFSKATPPSSYPEMLPAYLEKLKEECNNNNNADVVIEQILSESEVDAVVPIMAQSFALTPERWHDWAIGPDFALGGGDDHDEKRVHFVEWYMRWVFYTCINYGVVLVAKENKPNGNILGVVCTLPPEKNYAANTTSLLRFHMMKIMMKMKGPPPETLGKDALRRMDFMGEIQHHMHDNAVDSCSNAVSKEHQPWYVYVLATSPKAQGTGCGTMLLQAIHYLADHDKVDTILETSGEANIGFYCRPKLGYTKCGPEVSSADQPNNNGSDPVLTAQSLVRHPIPVIAVAAPA